MYTKILNEVKCVYFTITTIQLTTIQLISLCYVVAKYELVSLLHLQLMERAINIGNNQVNKRTIIIENLVSFNFICSICFYMVNYISLSNNGFLYASAIFVL